MPLARSATRLFLSAAQARGDPLHARGEALGSLTVQSSISRTRIKLRSRPPTGAADFGRPGPYFVRIEQPPYNTTRAGGFSSLRAVVRDENYISFDWAANSSFLRSMLPGTGF